MTKQFNPNIIPPMRSFTDFYIRVYTGILYNAALHHLIWIDLIQTAQLNFIPGVVTIIVQEGSELVDPWLDVNINGMDFTIQEGADHLPLLGWENGMLSGIDSPVAIYNCLQRLDASGVPFLPTNPKYYKVAYLADLATRIELSDATKVSHMALWIQRIISEFVSTYVDKERKSYE